MKKLMDNGEFCVVIGQNIGNTVLTGTYTENHTAAIVDFLSKCVKHFPYYESISIWANFG